MATITETAVATGKAAVRPAGIAGFGWSDGMTIFAAFLAALIAARATASSAKSPAMSIARPCCH